MTLVDREVDRQFWDLVSDGGSDLPPVDDFKDPGGGGGGWPSWASHLAAFLLGGITWGTVLIAPIAWPIGVLAGVVIVTVLGVKNRWR